MAITVDQKPNSTAIPIGQDVIFAISDATVLASHVNVRFYCDIMYSSTTTATQSKIVTLKTTPNAAGSGIFDLKRSIEAELGADYVLDDTNNNVRFKGDLNVEGAPIHHISQFTTSKCSSGNFSCDFYVKGSTAVGEPVNVVGSVQSTGTFFVFNFKPDNNDILYVDGGLYNYKLSRMGILQNSTTSQFLTEMPVVVSAKLTDVGTVGLLQGMSGFLAGYTGINNILFKFFDKDGTNLGTDNLACSSAHGGQSTFPTTNSSKAFLFLGVYPANLRQHTTIPSTTSYYTFSARSVSNVLKTKEYRVNIVEDCEYETHRLCWLNKFGTWDYYNFTVKSTKSTSATRKFYNSSRGDWSGSKFKHTHYKGGKTVYKMDSKDSITLNTEYLSEENGIWLEGLINSSEVFLIKEGSNWDVGDAAVDHTDFRDLVEPVVITNNAITRRTLINDKLIMHTFTIEKSESNNTHRS